MSIFHFKSDRDKSIVMRKIDRSENYRFQADVRQLEPTKQVEIDIVNSLSGMTLDSAILGSGYF